MEILESKRLKEIKREKARVIIAHPGTQHAPKLARQLAMKGYLTKYISILLWTESNLLIKTIKKIVPKLYFKLSNRIIPGIPSSKILIFPFIEITDAINRKLNKQHTENEFHYYRNKNFQLCLKSEQIKNCDIIIGFDTSSWILVDLVKANGKKFILDQSIGHPIEMAKVNGELNVQYPDWAQHITEKPKKFLELEEQEYEKASFIVVASNFSRNTLINNGIDKDKIFLNPYGVDLKRFSYKPRIIKDKIVYLFIGTVDVRKGIPFLVKSWKEAKMENCELWIVGPVVDSVRSKLETCSNIKVLGKVINVQLAEVMQQADVFVFPSFFEGFGLVILEALASGLPVITTTATAGPDIIENGEEGFVISPGNSAELIQSLKFFYNNRDQIELMGKKAREKAMKYTWKSYGDRWEKIINNVVASNRK
jgi:glycosyltransferase involved in cell wall biosynthesis